MKKYLLVIYILICYSSFAQTPRQLLQQSAVKCKNVANGYYEMEKSMKFMDQKDTNSSNLFKFYFQKLKDDSIYPCKFHYQQFYNGEYFRDVLYTGQEYVTFSRKDSTGEVMSKAKSVKTMMSTRYGDLFNFYAPFTGALYSPFPKESAYTDSSHIFQLLGQELIHHYSCFHIRVKEFPKYDSASIIHNIQTVYDYWINKNDKYLVKYSASSKVRRGTDTLQEYFSWGLKNFILNDPHGYSAKLQLSSIPSYCNIIDHTEVEKTALLIDTIAPNWNLSTFEGKQINLSDYKGQLVLIDFFYLSCYPCMQALPTLQSLHEKYKGKGLTVIGINPVDRVGNEVTQILSKRGVTYTTLFDTTGVSKNYRISSYPTVYLIDKNGKIIFSSVGFREGLGKSLEELIKQSL